MIRIYGMASCRDCAYLKAQIEGSDRYEMIDIGKNTKNLKAFLALRDTLPLFDDVKARGGIGIPCIVLEDGTVTLLPERAGLKSRSEQNTSGCCEQGRC